MTFHLVAHLPRLVMMVAKFFNMQKKFELFDLLFFSYFIFTFKPIATGWLQTIYFINLYICKRKGSNHSCIYIYNLTEFGVHFIMKGACQNTQANFPLSPICNRGSLQLLFWSPSKHLLIIQP